MCVTQHMLVIVCLTKGSFVGCVGCAGGDFAEAR